MYALYYSVCIVYFMLHSILDYMMHTYAIVPSHCVGFFFVSREIFPTFNDYARTFNFCGKMRKHPLTLKLQCIKTVEKAFY